MSGTSQPLQLATPAVSALIYTGVGTLDGWSLRETAGAAAAWRIRDGLTVAGRILAVGSLPASTSDTVWEFDMHFSQGLYFEVVAGTIEGILVTD